MARSREDMEILLVEDDEVDRMAVRRAFGDLGVAPIIVEAADGEEALRILDGESEKPRPNSPFLILLDINMPTMNGHEFLERLRAKDDPSIRDAIIFVLSTSDAQVDIDQAYAKNVAGYLVKSEYREGLRPVVKMIDTFGSVVRLP